MDPTEHDPTGRSAHEPGAKLDAGKPRPALVLGGFARALSAVTEVGTYGARKYTDNGWRTVPDGIERYSEAMLRHWLSEVKGEQYDLDTKLLHAAHLAWNALARLELMLSGSDKQGAEAAFVSPHRQPPVFERKYSARFIENTWHNDRRPRFLNEMDQCRNVWHWDPLAPRGARKIPGIAVKPGCYWAPGNLPAPTTPPAQQ